MAKNTKMTGRDIVIRLKEKNKTKQDNKNDSVYKSNSQSSGQTIINRINQRKAASSLGLDTFQSDLTSLSNTLNKVYSGWQTRETMDNTLSSVKSMYDRVGKYQDYQKKYGGTDLSELHTMLKDTIDNWDDKARTYGRYKNADEFNTAMENVKKSIAEEEKMKTDNLDNVKKDLDNLEGIYNKAKAYTDQINRESLNIRSRGDYERFQKSFKQNTEQRDDYVKKLGFESFDELEKLYGDKKTYLNRAEWIQKGIDMSSVIDTDYDFEQKSQYVTPKGLASGKEGYFKDIYKYINDESYQNKYVSDVNSSGEATLLGIGLNHMTDKEKALFNYYYNEQGWKGAEEYLKTITESLGNRKAMEDFEGMKGNTFKEMLFGVQVGLDRFATGMRNSLDNEDEYIPVNAIQQLSGLVRDDLAYEHGNWGTIPYDVITTTSNMLPSVLTSKMLGTINPKLGATVGKALMGASASGNAYQEMLNLGYDRNQAMTYSAITGISEVLLQDALGGISALGGTSKYIDDFIKGIDNAAAKIAIKFPLAVGSEALEEGLQEVLSPIIKNFAAGYDTGAKVNWEEVFYSALLGGLSGGIMEGAPLTISTMRESQANKQMGADIRSKERIQDLIDLVGDESVGEAYETYTQYAKKGINAENIKNAQLGRLYNEARSGAVETLNSKHSTEEQIASSMATLGKIGLIDSENTLKKTAIENAKDINIGEESKITKSGETVNVQNLKVKDGEVSLDTNKGTVAIDDITLKQNESELVGVAREIAKTHGDEVANLFLSEYDGKTDVYAYHNSFNLAMEYAKKDFSYDHIFKNVDNLSGKAISNIYKQTVFKAAKEKKSRFQELAKQMSDKKFYKGFVDDSAIDYDNTSAEGKINWNDLRPEQRDAVTFIKGFAQATGMNVEFIANNSGINGQYDKDTNVVTINLAKVSSLEESMKRAIIPAMSHETTHWMKEKTPELWVHLNEIVFTTLVNHYNSNTDLDRKKLLLRKIDVEEVNGEIKSKEYTDEQLKARTVSEKDLIQAEINRLKSNEYKDENKSDEELESIAREEIIARACEDLLSMSKEGRKIFANLTEEEKKTFAGKIKTLINDLMAWIDKALGVYKANSTEAHIMQQYKEQLQKASSVWDAMLKESVKVNQALEKNGTFQNNTNGNVVFSTQEIIGASGTSYGIGVYLDSNLLTNLTEEERREMVKEFVISELAGEHFIAYDNNKNAIDIRIATNNETIKLSNKKRKKVIKELYDKHKKFEIKQESIALIDELIATAEYDTSKKPSYSHDWLDNYGQNDWDYWTVYIQEKNKTVWEATLNIANTSNGEKILYDINPIKMVERAVLSATSTTSNIVTQENPTVKTNISTKDSTGRELSKGQQEYFKESTVRDENGNLLVMYRGDSSEVDEFDRKKSKPSNLYGRGFYFTNSKSHAEQYGNAREFYLDIKNPLSPKQNEITKEQMLKFLKAIENDGEDYDLYNYGQDATAESVLESVWGKDDFAMLQDINAGAIGDLVAAVELFNKVNGTTYDGIVLPTETVIFNSEQAKLTSNLNPTKNKNVRFSMQENYEETKDLVAVHNVSPEKLSKTLKLGGLPMPSIAITRAREGYNNFGAISLVFNKDTIDPEFMRSNKVYSGDAWTPTYPRIAYKVNEKEQKKIKEKIDVLVPNNIQKDLGGLHLDSYNIEDSLNRNGDMVSTYRYNYAMKYAFLKDNNVSIELPTKETPFYRYGEVSNSAVVSFANKMVDGLKTVNSLLEQHSSKLMADADLINGIANVLNEEVMSTVDENTEAYNKLVENPIYKTEDIDLSTVLGMLEAARKYFHSNGKVESEVDYRGAREKIDDYFNSHSLEKEYEYWLRKTFSNIIAKEGIRNNKDLFTPSGNRRSFEALHYEHTLENVVKAMKEEGTKGIGGFGGGNIFGASTQEYGSIDEIKADAENRMKYLPESEYQEIKKGFSDRLFELANSLPIHKDSFTALDDAANMLIEAVSKFKTKSGMANYLRTESKGWANYSDYIVDDLIELVNDIRNMPVQYFEAKPQRAVGFDEIKAVVMPSQESYEDDLSEVKNELEKLGISVLEYEYGDNDARIKALNSIENVRFSSTDPSVYEYDYGRDTEIEKLKADVETLRERLALEKKITGGNEFNRNQLGAVAGHLRKISGSNMDKLELMKALRGLYTHIVTSKELAWDDVWDMSHKIAKKMIEDSTPLTINDDYAKKILKHLQGSAFSLDESQKNEAQYIFDKHWNRNFMGKVKVRNDAPNIDSMWQEWNELFPDVFDADIGNNKIRELYDIIESLKDASETIDEYAMEEKTKWLAHEIYNQYWNVSPIKTTADKYNAKIKELESKHKKMMRETREAYEESIETQKLVDDMYYKRKLAEQKGKFDSKLAEQRKNALARQKEIYENLRARRDRDVEIAKQHGKDKLNKYKDNAERKTLLQSIMATATSLNKKLEKNDKDVHIPEALKPVVINLINAIDYSSKQLLGMKGSKTDMRGIPTKRDIELDKQFGFAKSLAHGSVSLRQSMSDALEMFQDAEKVINNTSDGTMDMNLPSLDIDLIDKIKSTIKSLEIIEQTEGSTFVLNKMSNEHLKTLNATVKSINHWANQIDYALASEHKARISEGADGTCDDVDVLGKNKEYIGVIEELKKFGLWSNLTPIYAFERLGTHAMKYFESLQNAQGKLAKHKQEVMDFTAKLFDKKLKNIKKWRTEIKEFTLKLPNGDTKTVKMPVSYVMTLYCLAKQEDAQRHLTGRDENGNQITYEENGKTKLGGGMTIAPFKDGKLTVSREIKATRLTEALIEQITSQLTQEQKNIADALQEYMNSTGSKWGNEVSEKLYGIKKFNIENYFPISVSPTEIKSTEARTKKSNRVHFYSILNYGFTKTRNPNAKQSIEIGDIFEVFANHMSMVAIYNSYALPIFDIVRWYNYKGVNGKGKDINVQASIEEAFGTSAINYIDNLLSDLNGQNSSSRLGFVTQIFRNTKLAMVGNSLSVALLQPTAYLKAMTQIPTRHLLKSLLYVRDFGARKGIQKAKEHCGIALWKSQGNFDNDISTSMQTQILHDEKLNDKLKNWSLKGAEIMDELTWGVLWNAVEFDIRANRKDLKIGSPEYFKTVADKLENVIYKTQVVDSPLTRSDIMRSPDNLAKMLTMFGSEMTVAYNMVAESFVDAKLYTKRNGKKGSLKRNAKKIGLTMMAYTLTSAASQILNTMVQLMRDDEDKEPEEIMKMHFSNFLSDWLIFGKIPYVKEYLNSWQGYSSSRPDTLWMDSSVKAIKYFARAFEGEDTGEKAIKESLKTLSYLSGVPMYNLYRDVIATLDTFKILDAEDFKEMLNNIFY